MSKVVRANENHAFLLLQIFLFICFLMCKIQSLSHDSTHDQIKAVEGLITRVLESEEFQKKFQLTIDPSCTNYFEIYSNPENSIVLKSSNGIGLSSAFYYYLKNYMNSSYDWETKYISKEFPIPSKQFIQKSSLVEYRYFLNVCAFGYTMAAWPWRKWERLIDWMALRGINLPLAFVGQEYIWMKTFKSFGITEEEMLDYFTGSHFLVWNRMGNIKKWAGPLSMNFINNRNELQKKILERMRSFGMTPVLPGFAGFVPDAFVKRFPNSTFVKSAAWNKFNESYTRNYLLEPKDPLFETVGSLFIKNLIDEWGTDHFYNADTFNEMTPSSRDLDYLKETSSSVYNAMLKADKNATWIMQGWLFVIGRYWWTNKLIEAYLSPIPDDKLIILDFWAEEVPFWKMSESFFGKKFIWCMFRNFGGERSFLGNIFSTMNNAINDKIGGGNTMSGLGITSEAINLPPFPYEIFSDIYLRNNTFTRNEYDDWIEKMVISRYGESTSSLKKSWIFLKDGPFSFDAGIIGRHKMEVIGMYPSLSLTPISNSTLLTYTANAYRLFFQSQNEVSSITEGFLYDFVDITRQYLSNLAIDYYNIIYYSYDIGVDKNVMKDFGNVMLTIIDYMDQILLTNENFLLGIWIKEARDLGITDEEKSLLEFNARNQITNWGPIDHGVNGDYARKHWGSLVKIFYQQRWATFIDCLVDPKGFNQTKYDSIQKSFEYIWQFDKTSYPIIPIGDTLEIGKEIYNKFGKMPDNYVKIENQDAIGKSVDIGRASTNDVVSLAILCNSHSDCEGFNTNGFLKNNISLTVITANTDLYIKKKH